MQSSVTKEKYAQPLVASQVSSANHLQNQRIFLKLSQTIQKQEAPPHFHTRAELASSQSQIKMPQGKEISDQFL